MRGVGGFEMSTQAKQAVAFSSNTSHFVALETDLQSAGLQDICMQS